MPKSDTWPGGIGMEPMTGMDSAGSCDSVLSTNSGFSDDSLEHLTAEEKACIMFLEETIESLDTEEDSGLSNDEPDQLPSPGNLANKLADLSASMSRSKLSGLQKAASQEPVKEHVTSKPMQSYLVPTPFVVASSAPCSAKPGVRPDKSLGSKPHVTPSSNKHDHKYNQNPGAPQVPLEVNVVIPPPTKPPRDHSCRAAEDLPRGPLSYEALFHLRRSASTKKTPLCPTIDHTIDLDRHLPIREEGQNIGNPLRSDRFHSEAFKSKAGPPVVAPKPKRIPGNISVKTQNETSTASDSYNIKNAKDPKVVRLEALQKLGLQPSHSSVNPTANRFTSEVHPSRSTSFYHSQVPAEPKNRPLHSSASFHHYARCDSQPALVPAQTNAAKAGGLERSATMDSHRNGGNCQAEARVPSNSVGYTVMVVPGMGADRREALRKLGLLKD